MNLVLSWMNSGTMFTGSRFNLLPIIKRITAAVLFALVFSSGSFSETFFSGARITPGPFWVQASAWPDTLSAEQVIESSLAASGLSSDKIAAYKTKYGEMTGSLNARDGDSLLQWLHAGAFKQYSLNQSSMDVLIDKGLYNCVSSSILFLILTKTAGIEAEMVEVPDHAFCRIKTAAGWTDVETTTPYGFNPGVKKEFVDDFKRTGFTYVPPGNYSNRRILTDKEAVGLIIQNRMAELQKRNNHREVVGLSVDRWTFDRSTVSFRDMRDAFRNYTADLNSQNRFKEAYYFILKISALYGQENENHDLIFSMAHNCIVDLLNRNDFNSAKRFLAQESDNLTEQETGNLKKLVTEGEISFILSQGNLETGAAKAKEAFSKGIISASEWDNYVYYVRSSTAAELSKTTGYWEAYLYLSNLPEDEKRINNISVLTEQMHYNWEAGVHNTFVDYYNNKEFELARKTLEDGLARDPESKIMLRDLSRLDR